MVSSRLTPRRSVVGQLWSLYVPPTIEWCAIRSNSKFPASVNVFVHTFSPVIGCRRRTPPLSPWELASPPSRCLEQKWPHYVRICFHNASPFVQHVSISSAGHGICFNYSWSPGSGGRACCPLVRRVGDTIPRSGACRSVWMCKKVKYNLLSDGCSMGGLGIKKYIVGWIESAVSLLMNRSPPCLAASASSVWMSEHGFVF